ncbi:MAG TPA: zeta toxin family protein [Abditibacteriaceae bacterium]|jgi:predicted ABC-type ATPase
MAEVYLIGGPNGAGKTTTATKVLPTLLNVREFVNADYIARGLSPFNESSVAVQAGRLMLQRLKELSELGEDFAFESTLAARHYVVFLKRCQERGYEAIRST